MVQEINPFELAGASDSGAPDQVEPDPDKAVPVTPISFDKDVMDFRPTEYDEQVLVPKGSSVLAHVSAQRSLPTSTTGLEDVSSEDLNLETNPPLIVPPPVGTGT